MDPDDLAARALAAALGDGSRSLDAAELAAAAARARDRRRRHCCFAFRVDHHRRRLRRRLGFGYGYVFFAHDYDDVSAAYLSLVNHHAVLGGSANSVRYNLANALLVALLTFLPSAQFSEMREKRTHRGESFVCCSADARSPASARGEGRALPVW